MAILVWKETTQTIRKGSVLGFNLVNPRANIVQIINRKAKGGGNIFVDTLSNLTNDKYALKVEQGNVGSLVRPYSLQTIYLSTDAPSDLEVTIIEIENNELGFVFNASQVVQIQGRVQIEQPVQVTGNLEIGKDLDIRTIPAVELVGFTAKAVTGSGDQSVKVTAGKVAGIQAGATADLILKDSTGALWKVGKGTQITFPVPIQTSGNITLNLSAADTAYIIYK